MSVIISRSSYPTLGLLRAVSLPYWRLGPPGAQPGMAGSRHFEKDLLPGT